MALRSIALGTKNVLSYASLLSKMQMLDPNLKGLKIFTNNQAFALRQHLMCGRSIKHALSLIKKTSSSVHTNSLLYCNTYVVQLNASLYKGYITIYSNPAIPYIPSLRIILRYPTKKCLSQIEQIFPDLLLSKAEFATDIMCDSAEDSRTLYEYMMRHLYIPYRRKSSIKNIGMHGMCVDPCLKSNHAFKISGLKIYERGLDTKRKKLDNGKYGWEFQDIRSIRIEYNIDAKILKKMGVFETIRQGTRVFKAVTLRKFLDSPIDPNNELNTLSFKQIKKLKKGNIFLRTYASLNAKEKKEITLNKKLQPLLESILEKAQSFAQKWAAEKDGKRTSDELIIEDDISVFEDSLPFIYSSSKLQRYYAWKWRRDRQKL